MISRRVGHRLPDVDHMFYAAQGLKYPKTKNKREHRMTKTGTGLIVIGLLGIGLAACVKMQADDPAPGKVIYDSYCVSCHGPSAQGDGKIAEQLPVAPADLTQLSATNGGVFPAERVMTQIYGYPGRFHQGMMPEFGPILDGPSVEWTGPDGHTVMTPQSLLDLTRYLEGLQQ